MSRGGNEHSERFMNAAALALYGVAMERLCSSAGELSVKRWSATFVSVLLMLATTRAVASAGSDEPPKLVVVIVIDQFGSDLFNQYRMRFRHGFKALSSGIVYPNAYHLHGVTETCAGHAVIATGRHPSAHGVIANLWHDPRSGRDVYCTEDESGIAALRAREHGVGPGLLRASTLGDWLKAANPRTRVFSVAGKDRAAVMLGGHSPDGAFWFDGKSSFDAWGRSAEEARSRVEMLSGLNHSLSNRESKELPPWLLDKLTLDAAWELIEAQKLGRHTATDLLAISLSGTDVVGHASGTQGPEMRDHLARLDVELGRFVRRLQATSVPFLTALTADHGGPDAPERLASRGYRDADRLDGLKFVAQLNEQLRRKLSLDWDALRPAPLDPAHLSVTDRNGRAVRTLSLKRQIVTTAIDALREQAEVMDAWSAEQLLALDIDHRASGDALPLSQRMALSTDASRSGDILVAFAPGIATLPAVPGKLIMGHSSPYDFNRRVPLLFFGEGLPAQERAMPVRVVDLVPTLARWIGVSVPRSLLDGNCLELDARRPRCSRP